MKLSAELTGAEQVPEVQTQASGRFQGMVSGNSISYRLAMSGLTGRVTAAHIHLGKRGENGGGIAFLCGGGGKPACPASGGTVTGTITAANVVATKGMKAGDMPALLKAIVGGDTYVNVHSTKYKDGEIRGEMASSM